MYIHIRLIIIDIIISRTYKRRKVSRSGLTHPINTNLQTFTH